MMGKLPEGWRVEKFGDIFEFEKKSKIKASEGLDSGKYPFYTSSKILKKYINENNFEINEALIFGTGGLASIHYATGKFSTSTDCFIVKQNKNYLNTKYIYNYLSGNISILENGFQGAGLKHISKKYILNIDIPIPPLPQQEKIVKVLDISFALVEKQSELIKKYDLFLKAKFIEMFGDPISNPFAWEIKTIEEIVKKEKHSIKRGPFGGALKKEIFVKEGYLVYEQFHALNNDFSMARYFIDEEKFNELKGFEVKSGDIIISCSGVYLGKLAIIPLNSKKGIINQALLKISLDEMKMKNILFIYIFTNENFKKRFFGDHIGSGIPNFPPMSDFKKFEFIAPPITLQNKFAQIVEKIELIKEKENKKLASLQTLHNSLMDKAFKGEIL